MCQLRVTFAMSNGYDRANGRIMHRITQPVNKRAGAYLNRRESGDSAISGAQGPTNSESGRDRVEECSLLD